MKQTQTAAAGFTLTEIMITVAIIGILSGIAAPYYLKARERSHRNSCMCNMRKIQDAKERFAMTAGETTSVSWDDIRPYLQHLPTCPSGGTYQGWEINTPIYCTVHDWRNSSDYQGFVP